MLYQNNNAHCFAFYLSDLSLQKEQMKKSGLWDITDAPVCHRIIHVLRLQPEDTCILFDDHHYAYIKISALHKKYFTALLIDIHTIKPLQPSITFLLPLLKRDALAEAIYGLVETGASKICLVYTQKTQRSWQGDKELARLRSVSISAAEQSKNFSLPLIEPPRSLEEILKNTSFEKNHFIFFDPQGESFGTYIKNNTFSPTTNIVLTIGPEGDLTSQEKELLRQHNATFLCLTPTILRAQQTAPIATALIRSLI